MTKNVINFFSFQVMIFYNAIKHHQ